MLMYKRAGWHIHVPKKVMSVLGWVTGNKNGEASGTKWMLCSGTISLWIPDGGTRHPAVGHSVLGWLYL